MNDNEPRRPESCVLSNQTIAVVGISLGLCLGVLVLTWIISWWPQQSLSELDEEDLLGIWEARYSGHGTTDTITFNVDGTYQQMYRSGDYIFASPGNNSWHLENISRRQARVYLDGARYYPRGIEIGELEGLQYYPQGWGSFPKIHGAEPYPRYLFDEHNGESISIAGRLVLTIEPWFSPKGFVLRHLWEDADSYPEWFRWRGRP